MNLRTQSQIEQFLDDWRPYRARTIVIVDYSNVRRWQDTLGWDVSIPKLGRLAKRLASNPILRRFHCAADYGLNPRSQTRTRYSKRVIELAGQKGFQVVTKRVKYIADAGQPSGYLAKCDQDVDIVTDLFQHRDAYDRIVLFSGDGDFVPALAHLHEAWGKESVVVSARGACGYEVVDAHASGFFSAIIYAEDLKHALTAG